MCKLLFVLKYFKESKSKRLQRQIAKEQKKPKYSTQAQIAIKKELETKEKQNGAL